MQEKCNKRIRAVSIMLAAIMLLSVLAPAPEVWAAGRPGVPKSLNRRLYAKEVLSSAPTMNLDYIQVKNFPKGAKIKNQKSSNKKVLRISSVTGNSVYYEVLKAGKAVISFDVVYKGKTTPLKTKVTVRKYERPCSSFKVGNKEYASKVKKWPGFVYKYKGKSAKQRVSVKAAKGWKLSSIEYYNGKKVKKIKNKSYIKCGKNVGVTAIFQNKKTKEKQYIGFNCY